MKKLLASVEKKLNRLWERAIEERHKKEVEDEIRLLLTEARELSPKKVGAVIYVSRNTLAGQEYKWSLDDLEDCRREYCVGANLKVLRVFREKSLSYRDYLMDEMDQFCCEHEDEVVIVLFHMGPEMYFRVMGEEALKNASS